MKISSDLNFNAAECVLLLRHNFNFKIIYKRISIVMNIHLLAGGGLVCVGVGITLWIIGANRKNKIEIALKQFNVQSYNRQTQALGIGLTINF